jgi:hypothetical protein
VRGEPAANVVDHLRGELGLVAVDVEEIARRHVSAPVSAVGRPRSSIITLPV